MAQKLEATTADVLVAFQTIPGVDNSTIINAGDGKIIGKEIKVSPQGNGYYGFKMPPNSSVDFELLNTKYKVYHHSKATEETNTNKGPTITSWKEVGPAPSNKLNNKNWKNKETLAAIQRRLKILGYYNANVDGTDGKRTELAILNFQADNGLRTDRIPGTGETQPKLDSVIGTNKTGDVYINRVPLIRFERAPTINPEDTWSTQPYTYAPEIDDRGFIKTSSMGSNCYGPVVTMARETNFRIKIIRENLSNDAVLDAVSTASTKVEVITSSPLADQKKIVLELKAKDPGTATILIKVRQASGSIIVAQLYVIVLDVITLNVQPYWVTIGGTAPGSPPYGGSKDDWLKAFQIVNCIWWQYGIFFRFLPLLEKNLAIPPMQTAGRLSNVPQNNPLPEFNEIMNAVDTAGTPSNRNAINLLIVNDIEYSLGFSVETVQFQWPNGIAIRYDPSGVVSTGHAVAHELGHCLSLSNLTAPDHLPGHPDEEPDAEHRKDDLWSFRKLMYYCTSIVFNTRPNDTWIGNVGYGDLMPGGLVTVRDLPNEKADDECKKAHDWANPKTRVYHNP
jgi:hypothetical protein